MQNIKIVCGSKYASADPVQLQSRLNELTAKQTELLDRILEDMDNPDLNARLSELAAEKKTITEQLQELEQNMARISIGKPVWSKCGSGSANSS